MPISSIEKGVQESGYAAAIQVDMFYSCDIRSANSFASATIQADALSLIFAISVTVEDLSKVSVPRSFHIFPDD